MWSGRSGGGRRGQTAGSSRKKGGGGAVGSVSLSSRGQHGPHPRVGCVTPHQSNQPSRLGMASAYTSPSNVLASVSAGGAETGSAFWLEKKTRASASPSPGSHCPRPGRTRARPPRRARGRTVRGNKFQPGRVGVGNVEGQRTFFLSFLWDGGRRIEQVGGSARARASPTRKKRRRSLSLPPGRGPSHTEKTMASPARPTPAAP